MSNWDTPASDTVIAQTKANLEGHGINVEVVETGAEALAKLKTLIPEGSEVMTGTSTTLNEIGFTEFLGSNESKWVNVHAQITAENDDQKRNELRRTSVTSEYFLASVNAISQTGALIACDATGSRVGAFHSAAKKLVLVAGTQKITESIETAMQRVKEYVFPLEDKRAQAAYGFGSSTNKWIILEKEANPDRITLILVKEKLGF